MDALNILLYPFLGCVLLVMIHAYFGLHVLERGIIFVDLALAQFIGLGLAFALLLGHGLESYWFSLSFALIGASILSLSRYISKIVYIEAFIGVLYVFSFALSILILDRTPHGAEEFKAILSGNILWIGADDVLKMFILYTAIGIFHFIFRKKFLPLSYEGQENFLWEFLFFLSFALVLASSVQIAGTLQVFVFLILPVLIGKLYTKKPLKILLGGWVIGITVTFSGIAISYFSDLPTSAVIVAALSITFFVLLIERLATKK
ncbi:metal ABC transporter permease [bacterium]|nr:metal ABC transporter permease [bacterium]